jgi:large subunit ribosomal protein L4
MPVPTFTKSGNKSTTAAKLDKKVFGVTSKNHELLKQAYVAYLANGREASAKAKSRGEVRGGGKKPWRQKGTGRARFGSSRNPIWRGGGVAFGPTGYENHTQKLPVKTKRQAIREALSLKANENKVIVIENLEFKTSKTGEAAKLFNKIGAFKHILVVVDEKSPELLKATSNLKNVKLVQAKYMNIFYVMNADAIVVTEVALKIISDWLGTPEKRGTNE